MLDDRSYMRDEGPQHRFSATTILMFVLGACYALQIAGYYSGWSRFIDNHLALSTDGIRHFEVWQLVTYQFLHGGPGHILFNLLALWSFGKWVENLFGRNGLYAFFLLSGIAGGIAHAVAGGFMDRWSGPVVGASAGTMGLLAACCIMEPDGTLLLYFIPIRARYALIGTLGLSLFFTLVPENVTGVAHTAHLGGLVAGLAFMRYGLPGSEWIEACRRWIRARTGGGGVRRTAAPPAAAAPPGGGDFISREIDPILEKISAQGIHSLTAEERRILEAAQKRMNR